MTASQSAWDAAAAHAALRGEGVSARSAARPAAPAHLVAPGPGGTLTIWCSGGPARPRPGAPARRCAACGAMAADLAAGVPLQRLGLA